MTDAGWVLCSYADSESCPLTASIKAFNTSAGGTSGLKRHADAHKRVRGTKRTRDGLPNEFRNSDPKKIADASALAVIQGLLPLSFAETNVDMLSFMRAVLEMDQSYPVGDRMNVRLLLPNQKTVRAAVKELAAKQRESFRESSIATLLKYCGCITCDGLKQQTTGVKYYDLFFIS